MILTDTASREVSRPEGIANSLQVIADAGMPISGLGNLLAKDEMRARCSNKLSPDWPEMLVASLTATATSSGG